MNQHLSCPPAAVQGADPAKRVTVLAIVRSGVPSLSLHQSQAAAWEELMRFTDANWAERMGSIVPPADAESRANLFFRHQTDDLYAIIDADVSELHEALETLREPVVG